MLRSEVGLRKDVDDADDSARASLRDASCTEASERRIIWTVLPLLSPARVSLILGRGAEPFTLRDEIEKASFPASARQRPGNSPLAQFGITDMLPFREPLFVALAATLIAHIAAASLPEGLKKRDSTKTTTTNDTTTNTTENTTAPRQTSQPKTQTTYRITETAKAAIPMEL